MRDISLEDGMRPGTHFIHAKDGHSYYLNKVMKGGRWSLGCIFYRRKGMYCKGRASVGANGMGLKQTQRHNHRPDWNIVHERRLRSAILVRCRSGGCETLQHIYDDERRKLGIPRVAAANIPYVRLRPAMQKARASSLPNLPKTLNELDETLRDPVYSYLAKTLDRNDNIYSGATGSLHNRTRCLIFISRRMLRYLKKVKKIFSDATFCVVPTSVGANQIWNLVTIRRHHTIPIGSILMQSRLTECYRVAVKALKHLVPGFRPCSIMCDYENAQQKAWSLEFPNADRYGCLFHASKAILGKAKELGLIRRIMEEENVESAVRSLCALPLLPHDQIPSGLVQVAEVADQNGNWRCLKELFYYVLETWLRPSRLPIFSVHGCEDRTSNCCESYNSRMQAEVPQRHPNVFHLIFALKRLEDNTIQDLYTLRPGGNARRKRKCSAVANDVRIKGLNADLAEGNISARTFLRRASRRMQGVFNDVLGLNKENKEC